jgi:iron complex outermembrane recepter protein
LQLSYEYYKVLIESIYQYVQGSSDSQNSHKARSLVQAQVYFMGFMRRSLLFFVNSQACILAFAFFNCQVVLANEKQQDSSNLQLGLQPTITDEQVDRVGDLQQVPTSIQPLLTQEPAPAPVKITGVQVKQTTAGIEILLESDSGAILRPVIKNEGNTLTADIPNATLALTDGKEFHASNPGQGITNVSVTQLDANSVRVSITGKDAAPSINFASTASGLTLNLLTSTTSDATEEDEIEVVVTGEQQRGYRVPNATTATKTDTPLRDVPASIQVIPRQLLDDRQINRIQQIADNVPGVRPAYSYGGLSSTNFLIRGFSTDFNNFRDGFRDFGFLTPIDIAGIEQVEILKGPASVLYGQGSPGGIINTVSKKPLNTPRYAVDFTAGSFRFYRPTLDFTGPLNDDKTAAYRLNIAYENAGSFRDFVNSESIFVAPALAFQLGKDTTLNLNVEYQRYRYTFDRAFDSAPEFLNIPISRFLGEPDFNKAIADAWRISAVLEHRLSEDWKFRSAFGAILGTIENNEIGNNGLQEDRRTLNRYIDKSEENQQNYSLQNELTGKFNTGSIAHQILLGVELSRYRFTYKFVESEIAPIDIFNPVYGAKPSVPFVPAFGDVYGTDAISFYAQDLITLNNELKLLLGGRLDIARSIDRNLITNELVLDATDTAFSPRLGIVYQPIEPISLYFSYATSFNPVLFGTSATGQPFKPERGQQFEVGVKADLIRDRLSATLAAYEITKQNVLITDPDDDRFSIQTGEQKSRGIEFSLAGKLTEGWNTILSYAYTDAFVSRDSTIPVGDRLGGVPAHQFGLWNSYEIPSGDLKGLGVALGLYYASEVESSLPNNNVNLPSYFRVDAAISYKCDNWKLQLSVNNLTNVKYYTTYGGNGVIPQAPLSVLGTFSMEF